MPPFFDEEEPPIDHPAIQFEPHLQNHFQRDLSERDAAFVLDDESLNHTIDDHVEHTVWDEPALEGVWRDKELPENSLTYAKWLRYRWENTNVSFSWLITIGIILCAGPFSVFAALFSPASASTWFQILLITVIGPTTEEVGKIALALWVVEKRPFWFRSIFQIGVCAIAGGLVFAAIENVLYLGPNLFDWSNGLTRWRWTICVFLHTGCCFVSSVGLMQIWRRCLKTGERPQIAWGARMLVSAIVIHGVYNAFAVYLAMSGYEF